MKSSRPTRGELALVAAILFCGVGLRLAWPAGMSVEHYDEGVYASGVWFGPETNFAYPQLHLYAPPLLPNLIEASLLLVGPGWGAMLPNLLAGCATLLIAWWMARRWFGPRVATASLALIALSDMHQLYSRTALVDALLIMWMLLAFWLFAEAINRPRLASIVGAGIATGLAWSTKYNGWLPLAITAIALVLWVGVHRQMHHVVRSVIVWCSVAAVACVVWSPVVVWLVRLEAVPAVVLNLRQYVVGWSGWWEGLQQQYANHRYLESLLGCAGLGVAGLVSALLTDAESSARGDNARRGGLWILRITFALALAAGGVLLGSTVVLAFLAVASVVQLCRDTRVSSQEPTESFVLCLLAVWLLSLFVATPLYHPYPRLTLPWLACTWLLGGLAIVQWHRWLELRWGYQDGKGIPGRWPAVLAATTVGIPAVLVIGMGLSRFEGRKVPAIAPRNQLEPIAAAIHDLMLRETAGNEHVIFVYAEPSILFQLKSQGAATVIPLLRFDLLNEPTTFPTFVITGPHGHRTREYAAEWPVVENQLDALATFQYRPSDLVKLNLFHPRDISAGNIDPEEIRLYRLR